MVDNKTSIYDELRLQILELKKENDALKSDIEVLKRALADEVHEKYKAYQKLANKSTTYLTG